MTIKKCYYCSEPELYHFYSGEIPRITSFEKGFPGHLRRNSSGTDWEPDPLIMDERYVAVNIRNKGK